MDLSTYGEIVDVCGIENNSLHDRMACCGEYVSIKQRKMELLTLISTG